VDRGGVGHAGAPQNRLRGLYYLGLTEIRVDQLAATIDAHVRKEVRRGDQGQWYEHNRQPMRYGEYLVAGYPIGSGVAEGACRHLAKNRREGTGIRWTVEGARAMPGLRAIHLNGDWDALIKHHIETEQTTLYAKLAAKRNASYALLWLSCPLASAEKMDLSPFVAQGGMAVDRR
jgi:hypothetical protein